MRFVGIAGGKTALDAATIVATTARPGRIPTTPAGIARLVSALTALAPTRIVLEATGPEHRPLLADLVAAGLPTAVATPALVAACRHVRLGREQTDRADAVVVARFAQRPGAERRPVTGPDPARARRREVVASRYRLVVERTRRRNRRPANRCGGNDQICAWRGDDLARVEARLAEGGGQRPGGGNAAGGDRAATARRPGSACGWSPPCGPTGYVSAGSMPKPQRPTPGCIRAGSTRVSATAAVCASRAMLGCGATGLSRP